MANKMLILFKQKGFLGIRVKGRVRQQITGYLFVAPAVLFLVAITFYPIFRSIQLSVIDYSIGSSDQPFVGMKYYAKLFEDEYLWNALKHSFYFGFTGFVVTVLIGMILAVLLNSNWTTLRVRDFMRGLFVLPWMFSTTVAALMWGLILHRDGILNSYLTQLGLLERPIAFTGDKVLALPVVIAIFVWKDTPFAMVMILAALKSVPMDLYDAAKVDGASSWQYFRYVTVPLMMPVVLTVSILVFIWGFGHYDLVKVITGGGPLHRSEVVSYYLYKVAFMQMDFSYGSAISILIFVILLLFAILYIRAYTRSRPWQ